jgi:hypothetical protein
VGVGEAKQIGIEERVNAERLPASDLFGRELVVDFFYFVRLVVILNELVRFRLLLMCSKNVPQFVGSNLKTK